MHSYLLVKRVNKIDEENAAWLLHRVCKNISQFQQHAVTILTSAVIGAMKANLKAIAYQWSVILVRPEYRNNIN